MIPIRNTSRRAFTLTELIIVCPLLAVMLSLLTWALIYHMKLSRGVAAQSHRQEIMHRILGSLRTDLLEADSVVVEKFEGETTLPDAIAGQPDLPPVSDQSHRTLVAQIKTSRPAGPVNYYLIADSALVPRSNNSTLPDLPPEYTLVRLDPADVVPARVWPMHDLLLRVAGADSDAEGAASTTLRLVFESRQDLDARVPIRRVFDTTLRAGGAR
ncbi:MAG: hypothetical protein H6818_20520 [Phycisphaerales bacterium]|nr:hypothetical protein [Phycisphaerales bacterium]MCB9864173.1 hypothetical protein [Phycisphaerales bacterium]